MCNLTQLWSDHWVLSEWEGLLVRCHNLKLVYLGTAQIWSLYFHQKVTHTSKNITRAPTRHFIFWQSYKGKCITSTTNNHIRKHLFHPLSYKLILQGKIESSHYPTNLEFKDKTVLNLISCYCWLTQGRKNPLHSKIWRSGQCPG